MIRNRSGGHSLINEYYKIVIGGEGIKRYRKVIQYGAKEGQSLSNHIEKVIGAINSLKEVCKLTQEEEKVLLTASTIHDINKLPEYKEKIGYLNLVSEKDSNGNYVNLIRECELLDLDKFFPEYLDYIEDIREIISRHSAHLHSFAENLYVNAPRKLSRDRLEVLVLLLRAADVLDLSKTLDEKEKKEQFLSNLNAAISEEGIQYKLEYHRISEDRGILTNIIHNGAVEFLENKGLIPVAFYKEGTVYLMDSEYDETSILDDKEKMVKNISNKIKEKVFDDYTTFINNSQSGIKVDEKCLEITTVENIVYEISNISARAKLPEIDKKNITINNTIEKYKDLYKEINLEESKEKYELLKVKISEESDKKKLKQLKSELSEIEDKINLCIGSKKIDELVKENKFEITTKEDKLRLSMFIQGVYNFINAYIGNKKSELSWSEFYNLLDLKEEEKKYLDLIPSKEALFTRTYIIAEYFINQYSFDSEELINKVIDYIKSKLELNESYENKMWIELRNYIDKNLNLSFEAINLSRFKENFKSFSNKKHISCSLCSNEIEARDWMATDVPYKIKVQNFTNKLPVGVREPKRKICSICQIEYLLHKSIYSSGGEVSRRYLSVLPRGFQTGEYIASVKNVFEEFKYKDIGAIYYNSYSTFLEANKEDIYNISPVFTQGKLYGVAIPKYTEVLANYFIMPIQLDKKATEREVWVNSLIHALTFNIYFNSKIVISEFPLAVFKGEEIEEIYIDGIPSCYKNLFEIKWDRENCEKAVKLFLNLFKLAKELGETGDFVNTFLVHLNNGEVNFIYELYKLLKKKYENPSTKIENIKEIVEDILDYIKKEMK